jgi:SPP1 gp7 family putative phage head morphogenesis protein
MRPEVYQALKARAARIRKRRAPKIRPVPFPRRHELAYMRALKGYVRDIRTAYLREVLPILDYDGDGVANALPLGELQRALVRVQAAVLAATPSVEKAARVMVKNVTQHVTEGLNRSYLAAVGVAPFGPRAGRTDAPTSVEQVLANRLQANVYLIGSISGQALDQARSVIDEGFRSGLRVEDLAARLVERFDVAESRAILIARDQTGKLNAQITEARNREIGVTEYEWQTSGDGRVRDSHSELNGTVHRYDNPPVTNDDGDHNNPGEDYQCRCNAQPRLENVLEALGI